MSSFTVLTTFHKPGYDQYAKRMLRSFIINWPNQVRLLVYAEDCSVAEQAPNITVMDSHATIPELVAFKEKWRDVPKANGRELLGPIVIPGKPPGIGFKWDAVRFANKIYAVCHAATVAKTKWLIWMDADMVCHSPITMNELTRLCPDFAEVCYLGREGKYSECGLYALDLESANVQLFLKRLQAMYDYADNGIFKQQEWHDSYIWDVVRNTIPQMACFNWSHGLIRGEGHPLINCEWGKYLDHLKGTRKALGKSKDTDILVPRYERYWRG